MMGENERERERGRMFSSLSLVKYDFSFIVSIRIYLLSDIKMIIYAWQISNELF